MLFIAKNGKRVNFYMKKRTKRLILIPVLVLAILCGSFVWYVNDYYHAVDVSQAMTSSGDVTVTEIKNGYLFDGPGESTALIFYPGAKVEASAYAPLLRLLSENGIDCFLVKMPCNLAFFGINRASEIQNSYDYDHWYLAGHSLGGAMAASYASKHLSSFDALILLASYSTSDLSVATFPVLSLYGSNDGVLNREKLETYRSMMPAQYQEYVIEGGNHAGFGSYGAQSGDGAASISAEEQWQQTVSYILQF